MNSEFNLLVAVTSGAFALLGALGSQIINALVSLRAKRMELVYSRKADTYKEFMQKAGVFWNDPHDEEKHAQLVHVFFATTIIASGTVLEALRQEGGMYRISRSLHRTPRNSEEFDKKREAWIKIFEQVGQAMRDDLKSFSRL